MLILICLIHIIGNTVYFSVKFLGIKKEKTIIMTNQRDIMCINY